MKTGKSRLHRTLSCQPLETRRLLAAEVAVDCVGAPPDSAVEIAKAVEDCDPAEMRSRARISDQVDGSGGAHRRPGEGWESIEEDTSVAIESFATDIVIAAKESDPPQAQIRARISDEVTNSVGAHRRPGEGWRDETDGGVSALLQPSSVDIASGDVDGDPPKTTSRARVSDQVTEAGGAQQRPGTGWR